MQPLKHSVFIALIFLLSTLSFAAYADNNMTIINHFGKPLDFVKHINPDVLPDLQDKFTLQDGGEISTKVIDLDKRSYVRVEDNNTHSAYWGVKIENDMVNIHGYMSKGIAYSWNTQKIVFCTPEEYKLKKGCLN